MYGLLETIEAKVPKLSKSQVKVASYILQGREEAAFLSVTELAKEIGVSDTTVIRFCLTMGFDGYKDFKKQYQKVIFSSLKTDSKFERNMEALDKDQIYRNIIHQDIDNLQKMMANDKNAKNINRLVDLIINSNRVYTMGSRGSHPMALSLSIRLKYFVKTVTHLNPETGNLPDELTCIRQDDLVIAVAFPRYSNTVVDTINYLFNKGVRVAVITDNSNHSTFIKQACLMLACEIESSTALDSYTGCISLINVIIARVALHDQNQSKKSLMELEECFHYFNTFSMG